LALRSALLDNKYSRISRRPFSEAANQKMIHLIIMIFNIYSPQCKAVFPSLFVTSTSATFDNNISTISLCPHLVAVNKTQIVDQK
jgi:hypothetical protein